MTSLLILGAGGHARVVADSAMESGFERVGLIDDAAKGASPFPIVGRPDDLERLLPEWQAAIVGIGDNRRRLELLQRLRAIGFLTPSVIHPRAAVSRHANLAGGVFVAAGAVVGFGAAIGDAVIVNTGATVDHDCVLAAGVHISPGAHLGGNVSVGERSWVGIGAAVRHGIRIGADAVVGAGAVVVRELAGSETYVGSPARPLGIKPER
jgi:sugar O-acyltransferase (sialic acid O-acetyltransferase NeuD family)